MILLKPLINKPSYRELIDKKLKKFFDRTVYLPLLEILKRDFGERFNALNILLADILNGKIQYVEKGFVGQFSAQSSKELKSIGAKFSKRTKSWIIVDLNNEYSRILSDMDKGFREIVKTISIEPKISQPIKDKITEEYTENMQLYVKDWFDEDILELRDKVYKNTFTGYRADNLVKIIRKDYNVSLNKAKFLARQETSLLSSDFRKNRYKDVGIDRYKWSTAKDNRVRDRHVILEGKEFFWSTPPVINDKGDRGHPGDDFWCRCQAIPIFG
jgi:SPP1 gp7 family putative phage head morphogenesis protein